MTISIIVAMSQNRVIGKNNQIPWHISEDLKRFKKITMGHPIVMGRKTFESIGKPLPGRENIVLTKNLNYHPPGVTVVHSFNKVLSRQSTSPEPRVPSPEIFVIGGAEIYRLAFPHCTKIYLTKILKDAEGNTYFPITDLEKDFKVVEESPILVSPKENFFYQYITLEHL